MLDTMLNENVGPSPVIKERKAGETLFEGARRLGEVLSPHSGVEFLYILQGANDVSGENNTPLGEMLAAPEQMLDLPSAHSITPILPWVDLYQAFAAQPDWESFLNEGALHLSEQGQEFVAQVMYPVVTSLLE